LIDCTILQTAAFFYWLSLLHHSPFMAARAIHLGDSGHG
jgi:hypothetical protein